MKHLTNIDLSKNQLMNAATHNLASAPADPVLGQRYYNTTSNKEFYWNGTGWIQGDGEGATMTGENIVTAINGSSSIIDLDNLPAGVGTAVSDSHTHANSVALGNVSGTNTGDETATSIATIVNGATGKTTPADADVVPLYDGALKKVTWTNIKATLKTYFDTLYNNYSHPNHTGDVTSTGDGATVIANKAVTLAKMNDLAANTIIGRITASVGVPEALTAANVRTIINVADGANAYSHPNHSGDVTSTGDGATTIGANKVANTMLAQIATNTIKGRITATTGNVEDLTAANVRSIINVEDGADVTDAANVGAINHAAAGKTTPLDADTFPITNTAASNAIGKVTFTNLKAFLKTYFDTLYAATGATHTQNTDTGTTSQTFQLQSGSDGVVLKNNAGVLEARNDADSAYANIRVNDLIVEGTTTTINSNEVNIGDAEILLNADITTSAANSDGGIAVKRLMADNTTPKNAKMIYNNSTNRWDQVFGAVTGTLTTVPVAGKVVSNVGNGSLTSIVITHNLNTRDAAVLVREAGSPYAQVVPDVEFTDVNTVTLKFAVAPTSNQYVCTIIG